MQYLPYITSLLLNIFQNVTYNICFCNNIHAKITCFLIGKEQYIFSKYSGKESNSVPNHFRYEKILFRLFYIQYATCTKAKHSWWKDSQALCNCIFSCIFLIGNSNKNIATLLRLVQFLSSLVNSLVHVFIPNCTRSHPITNTYSTSRLLWFKNKFVSQNLKNW